MDYQRFLDAQEPVYEQVLRELRAGNKTSHWMWFIFPQLRDLGRSSTARFYGIENRTEAMQYLAHPVLGPRLKQCTQIMLTHKGRPAQDILHDPDYLKFRSCMTLFQLADPTEPIFQQALGAFYRGLPDDMTEQLLNRMAK
jgi:uncharacterized protein (DUF1810 family)